MAPSAVEQCAPADEAGARRKRWGFAAERGIGRTPEQMRLIVTLCLAALAACGPPATTMPVVVHEDTGGLAEGVQLAALAWDDSSYGGQGAVGLRLTFHNVSEQAIGHCVLAFNDNFRAPLSNLEMYRGFLAGNVARGRAGLNPGERVSFKFHHDNNNYLALRGPEQAPYGSNSPPALVTLACGDRRATWQLGSQSAAQR